MNRWRKRLVLSALFIAVWFAWWPIYATYAPGYPIRHGPRGGFVTTVGLFEPGGWVRFDVDTGISSVNGFYHASFVVRVMNAESFAAQGIDWPVVREERSAGYPWPSSIQVNPVAKPEIPPFQFFFDIPRNPSLKGQTIVLGLEGSLVYPKGVYLFYQDQRLTISHSFDIVLDENFGTPVSYAREVGECPTGGRGCPPGELGTFAVEIWLLGLVVAMVFFIVAVKKYGRTRITR